MTESAQTSFTALLARARQGDASAIGELFPLVYDHLKRIARLQRRHQEEATLNTTALVHEAFLKLAGKEDFDVLDRNHFLAVASIAMRQILIDYARQRRTARRGGDAVRISFDALQAALQTGGFFSDTQSDALLALDESLARLAQHSERQSRVVECRFFAGLSIEETAQALGTSPATVKRDWAMAQAWLYRDLRSLNA